MAHMARKQKKTLIQRVTADLTDAAMDVRKRLSGGETQRLKLARELADRAPAAGLYILDEPTVGLHRKDVLTLLRVLHELTRRGGTVIAVEHNLDFLAACDYLVELGPEGGEAGGFVVAAGTPPELARAEASPTAGYLRRMAACA